MINWDTFTAAGGEIFADQIQTREFSGAAVDSRAVQKNDIFIALKGERTDGHEYIEQAVNNGAAGVILSRDYVNTHSETSTIMKEHSSAVFQIVDDTLKALQGMAVHWMAQIKKNILKIGVTGSNGKTTTKELIGAVVSGNRSTFVNKGNLNSEIGLCKEVLRLTGNESCAVLEMGMNRIGEMDLLTHIVEPDMAVITNIGTAHIGLLGSVEGIAEEKKKIFSQFTGKETGFVYEDEPFFEFLREGVEGEILSYGRRSAGKHIEETDKGLFGCEVHFEEGTLRFPLIGEYNRRNMYAAYAVGKILGISFPEMKDGLESVKPLFGRGEVIRGDITVILDCYNANDESMREILNLTAVLQWKGRKIAVLGDLKELGDFSEEIHREIGKFAFSLPLDIIFFYGEEMRTAYEAATPDEETARSDRREPRCYWSEDMDHLLKQITDILNSGDLLLLKGSRSIELERVYNCLFCSKKEKTLC